METLVLIAIVSLFNIICFFIGAKIGQAVTKEKDLKFPNPINTIKEYKAEAKNSKELDKFSTMLNNIDNYPYNQKEL